MNMASMQSALKQYKQVGVQSGIESASPHRIIQMLMNGALEKISMAKGHIERNNVAAKGSAIGGAMSIIDGLRASLDKSVGGELVENLDALYDYMGMRLLEANLHNDVSVLDEVSGLLLEIKQGWDAIAQEVSQLEAEQTKTVSGAV